MKSADASFTAAEWTGSEFRLTDVPAALPGDGEVRVRVAACAVCLTEVHFIHGFYDELDAPPRLGHEFAGVVDAVGPGVTGLAAGDPVAGFGVFGGFAGMATGPEAMFQPLPPGLDPEAGCFLEPVSCCLQAVRNGRVPAGATVLVTGAGSNGLLIAQILRRQGAGRTIVSEPGARRRALALELGADEVLDPVTARLADALDGAVVNVAFETAGSLPALRDCIDVLADAGRVVVFGVNRDTEVLNVPVYRFHRRNLSLITSFGAERADAAAAAELLPSLALEPLISHRYQLTEIAAAFDAARTGAGLKVLVYPSITQASRCAG
jgi:threonine dehydrogenase-like Zn-dependent dehydrogenase